MSRRTVTKNYSIRPEHDKELRRLAKKTNSPLSELIREAIGLLVEKHGQGNEKIKAVG